jgi:hyperosmotically inducible protein
MRTMIRALLLLVLVAVVGFMMLNFRSLQKAGSDPGSSGVDTTGKIDAGRARERVVEIGEKAAESAKKIQETVTETGLTAKIKAKMALDDTLGVREIDVTTQGSTVTVSGSVSSVAARNRAIALARETNGVTTVIDRLEIVTPR